MIDIVNRYIEGLEQAIYKERVCTEALKVFLNDVMQRKELNKLYGICVSENIASKKVMEKNGFKKEYEGMGEYQGESRQIAKYVLKRA